MTDEEAIELLKKITKNSISLTFQDEIQAIETVLNLIEQLEQDIEKEKTYYEHARDLIEKYQDLVRMILNDRDKNFVPKAEIEKKDKIIEHWKNGFERELESNRENICEIIKQDDLLKSKDKIIDLMAERLTTPINSKEWVIDYYKRKVEGK